MKNLAKLLSLILALALVFALVGCESSNDDDDDDDSKPSSGAVDKDNDKDDDKDDSKSSKPSKEDKDDEDEKDSIVGEWRGVMPAEKDGYEMEFEIELTFNKNGKYLLVIDKDSMIEASIDVMEQNLEAEGIELDEYLEENDMTYDELYEYLETQFDESDTTVEGKYTFDGETFKIDNKKCEFELDGDTLTFVKDGSVIEVERA